MIQLPENKALILFDGVCNLCHYSIELIMRNDSGKRFYFAAIESETGQMLIEHLKIDIQQMDSIILYEPNFGFFTKAAAISRIAMHLRFPYSCFRWIKYLPKPISNWIYDCIASNRYKWFGKKEHCYLPTPEERERFI